MPEVQTGIVDHALVYLEKPTPAELEETAKAYLVNINTLRDALDPYEAPRFETDNDATYVFVRYPTLDKSERTTVPFLIVVSGKGILTISQEESTFMERFLNGAIPFDPEERTDLFLKLLSEINQRYAQGIMGIQRAVNRKKQNINQITENDIVEITTHEMALNDYMDALVPQTSTLSKLLAGKVIEIDPATKERIEDLILSVSQHTELTRSLLKTTADIRNAHMAISTQRLNVVIQRLTALTVLVTIPNVITGFYGMNVLLPFAENPRIVLFIFTATVAIVFTIALLLFRSRWL